MQRKIITTCTVFKNWQLSNCIATQVFVLLCRFDNMSTATSLKEQLQKLRAPQTNLLHDVKKRPSFLFDADKAASITRATFYEIGEYKLNRVIFYEQSDTK